MKRIRDDLGWTPVWEGEIERYAKKYVSKSTWRSDKIHSYEDHLHDAYLVFVRVKMTYPRLMEPASFMALFKVALANAITDKARNLQSRREVLVSIPFEQATVARRTPNDLGRLGEIGWENNNEGLLRITLREFPPELLPLLEVYLDPEKVKLLREKTPKGNDHIRETLIMKLCRIAGVEFRSGMLNEFRNAIRG